MEGVGSKEPQTAKLILKQIGLKPSKQTYNRATESFIYVWETKHKVFTLEVYKKPIRRKRILIHFETSVGDDINFNFENFNEFIVKLKGMS